MADRTGPIVGAINKLFDETPEQLVHLGRRLRQEFERTRPEVRMPPPMAPDEIVAAMRRAAGTTSPSLPPEEQEIVDRYRQPSPIDEDRAKLPEILAELRVEAEALLDGTDEGDSDRHVILEALKVLARVEVIVVRELGRGWRRQVRPFGALARRRGTQVGAAWVGDTAGGVEPISLADAVDHLVADRAQWQREADASRTAAGLAAEQSRDALQRAATAQGQMSEIRRLLDRELRPNAYVAEWCEVCQDEGPDACEDHRDVLAEPLLSDDLADEVRRLIELWHDAQAEARSAARGRVSVYLDGQLVTGPPALFEATLEPTTEPAEQEIRREVHHVIGGGYITACNLLADDYHTSGLLADVTCPRCVAVVATRIGDPAAEVRRVYPWPCARTDVHQPHHWQGTPPGYVGGGAWRCPGRTWGETEEAREALHGLDDTAPGGLTACGLPSEDYRCAGEDSAVTCAHCAVTLGLPASQILDPPHTPAGADLETVDGRVRHLLTPPDYRLPEGAGVRYRVVTAGLANLGGRTVAVRQNDTVTAPDGWTLTG